MSLQETAWVLTNQWIILPEEEAVDFFVITNPSQCLLTEA